LSTVYLIEISSKHGRRCARTTACRTRREKRWVMQ